MFIIGLTGGIGTGKTEVSKILQSLGVEIINADLLGHEVYRPNSEGWREVIETFGEDVAASSGEIEAAKRFALSIANGLQLDEANVQSTKADTISKLASAFKANTIMNRVTTVGGNHQQTKTGVVSSEPPAAPVMQNGKQPSASPADIASLDNVPTALGREVSKSFNKVEHIQITGLLIK